MDAARLSQLRYGERPRRLDGRISFDCKSLIRIALGLALITGIHMLVGLRANASTSPFADLEQWLHLAYVESQDRAGFGDYPIEVLDTPSLYSTSGAVAILSALGVPIPDEGLIAGWIQLLQTDRGLYDDPSVDAPPLVETFWALSALHELGHAPDDLQLIRDTLLGFLDSDGLAQAVDGSGATTLSARLSAAWQIVRCLSEAEMLEDDTVRARLETTLARCLTIFSEMQQEIASLPAWSSDDSFQLAWTMTNLIAAIDPNSLPECGCNFLRQQLEALECAPVDFLGPEMICPLLDAAAVVLGWEPLPNRVVACVESYLVERVSPTLEPLGAFGWTNSWGMWVDPMMNVGYIGLYGRTGSEYPDREGLLAALEVAHIATGWVRVVLAVPHPDFTYFGVTLCRAIGATFFSAEKLIQSALMTIDDPNSDLQDLLYSVRILKNLGHFGASERSSIEFVIARMAQSDLEDGAYWLVPLALEASITPTGNTRAILEDRLQNDLVLGLREAPLLMLRELALLRQLLDDGPEPSEIAEAVLSLQSPAGGFLSRPFAPYPDLLSTLSALQVLDRLGQIDNTTSDSCRQWVETCHDPPGYGLVSPGDLSAGSEEYHADLYTTYMGFAIRGILTPTSSCAMPFVFAASPR